MIKRLFAIGLLNIVFAVTGGVLWSFVFAGKHNTVLGITTFCIAVTTFFGVMALNNSTTKGRLNKESLQTAIASTIVITYICILCFSVFLNTPSEMGALTQSFVTTLSNVVGVTIVFYFSASAFFRGASPFITSDGLAPSALHFHLESATIVN